MTTRERSRVARPSPARAARSGIDSGRGRRSACRADPRAVRTGATHELRTALDDGLGLGIVGRDPLGFVVRLAFRRRLSREDPMAALARPTGARS